MTKMMAKRLFDIVLASILLAAVSPLIAVTAVAVVASVGRPILFRQSRVGLGGSEFRLFKFRTMREAADETGKPLADELRVSQIGRVLRRTRLDELPELLLVIGGQMSLVGPRPLPREVLHGEIAQRRSRVRPGLTGLAQVSGNTLLDEREKFAVDLLYPARQSIALDIRILVATLRTVIQGERRNEALIKEALDYAQCPDRRG